MSHSEGSPHTPQETPGRSWRNSHPHWHVLEPDMGQQAACSPAPAGRQRLVCQDGGRGVWEGAGDKGTRIQDRHFRSAVPCLQVPPWAQASWLHRWLLCFAALGQLGWTAPLGKRGTKSLLCPQQHGHITASMVLKSACNNQVESTLPVQCPHGAVHVHP